MPLLTLLLDTASEVEVLFALIAGAGIYYPFRIAVATGCTARELYRRWHTDHLAVDRSSYVITFAPTIVIAILSAMAAAVMAIFFLVGLLGMFTPPGSPNPNDPGNAVFRWALIGGFFTVVVLKNIAVYAAFRVYKWGEETFAGESLKTTEEPIG